MPQICDGGGFYYLEENPLLQWEDMVKFTTKVYEKSLIILSVRITKKRRAGNRS